MATNELKVGVQQNQDGASILARGGRSGETMTADAHARFQEAVLRGNVYYQAVPAGAATAFTGGAGGTPFIGVMNPVGSGKNLVFLGVGFASRVAASAAGTVGLNLWAGVSVLPTGTQTASTNALSQQTGGSVARAFNNAANTSSTATTLALPLASYYWATAAGAIIAPTWFDIGGLVVAAPGVLVCLGGTAALTSATYDVVMYWEEVPV